MTLAPVHDDATIDEAVAALARELGGYLIAADAGLGSVPLEVRVTRRWREVDSNFRFRVRCKRRLKAKIGGLGSMPPSIICGCRRWRSAQAQSEISEPSPYRARPGSSSPSPSSGESHELRGAPNPSPHRLLSNSPPGSRARAATASSIVASSWGGPSLTVIPKEGCGGLDRRV